MIKIKTNYSLLFLLIIGCWLFIAAPTKGQTPETDIVLTWSTNTYVPLNYQGKALPIKGSVVKVTANINSSEFNPQELIYDWFLDDDIQKSDSGQGKQVFQFNIDKSSAKKHLIRVKIENIEGVLLGTSSYLVIMPQNPEIVLEANIFSKNPNKEYQISGEQEVKFIAKPYFFNIKNIDELDYSWSLNGKIGSQISNDNPNVFTLKVGQIEQAFEQDLMVQVKNKNNPSEKAQFTVKITFIP